MSEHRIVVLSVAAGLIGGIAGAALFSYVNDSLRLARIINRRRFAQAMESEEAKKMLASQPYNPGKEEIIMERLQTAHNLCVEMNSTRGEDLKFRDSIIKELLGSFPADSKPYIEPPFYVDYGSQIHLGKNFYCNFGCTFLDCAEIRIGDNVFLAPGVQIYTATHPLDHKERQEWEYAEPITIGDDVWIGGHALILPGVTIGSRSVIAAGAVVNKDVPDDVVVAGCPAKVIRKIQ
mmetsp:Transcript_32575/g.50702  ORF Transcript_32575/g.50702 Transcript_32575/m.50702 type:complete len:235 (-) Transcript_32575:228-932(-)